MIEVRDVFQVKFGYIDQAVDLFTKNLSGDLLFMRPEHHFNILTDLSGPMYTMVTEYVAENLGEYETISQQGLTFPGFEEWFKQFQLYIDGGRREFYTVEGAHCAWSRPGMVVVRENYRAYKWQIRKTVDLLQRYGGLLVNCGVGSRARILTDVGGPMFQAIIEVETESLSLWEERRRDFYRQPEFRVWFNQLLTTVEAGRHNFHRVEYTGG